MGVFLKKTEPENFTARGYMPHCFQKNQMTTKILYFQKLQITNMCYNGRSHLVETKQMTTHRRTNTKTPRTYHQQNCIRSCIKRFSYFILSKHLPPTKLLVMSMVLEIHLPNLHIVFLLSLNCPLQPLSSKPTKRMDGLRKQDEFRVCLRHSGCLHADLYRRCPL